MWPAAPPIAVDDSFQQPLDGPLDVPAKGILRNDSVPCGATAKVTLVSGPSHGTLDALGSDGSFSYMPDTPAEDDEFVYEINCNGLTAQATVKLPAPLCELSLPNV